LFGEVARHPFGNAKVLPLFVCSTDRCQITVEPEPSDLVLGLLQRLEDWFDVLNRFFASGSYPEIVGVSDAR
jgi:hypothetical protein